MTKLPSERPTPLQIRGSITIED